MKRKGLTAVILKRAGLAALLWLPLCPATQAEPGRPGGIFDFGAGARPLGMGGAYTAAAADATALYYNPAGLSFMSNRNLALMHAQLFEGTAYDYAAYGQNFTRLPGGWGMQLIRLAASGAEGRDEYTNITQKFGYSETAFALGTGLRGVFLPFLSLGASVKVLSRSMDGYDRDMLAGLDLGAQYWPLYDGKLTVAFTVQNLGGFASGDTADSFPLAYKLGAAYTVIPGFLLSADVQDFSELRLGAEYLIGAGAVRLGYDRGSFSGGVGMKFLKSYQVDFAMTRHETLGLSNRISLNYFFGGYAAAPPKIQEQAVDYIAKAEKDLRERDYVAAADAVDQAIGMNPGIAKGPWGDRGRRLKQLNQGLMLRGSAERRALLKAASEQAAEANYALTEYVAGRTLKSVLLAHSAAGYDPNNAFYSELLRVVAALNSREVAQDEILPRPMLITYKTEKAASLFYAQSFEKVVKECLEILLLDEANAAVWKKLGSAYFAAGDADNARRAYEKVLKLDPNDESVLRFMDLQGWK